MKMVERSFQRLETVWRPSGRTCDCWNFWQSDLFPMSQWIFEVTVDIANIIMTLPRITIFSDHVQGSAIRQLRTGSAWLVVKVDVNWFVAICIQQLNDLFDLRRRTLAGLSGDHFIGLFDLGGWEEEHTCRCWRLETSFPNRPLKSDEDLNESIFNFENCFLYRQWQDLLCL